MQPAVFTPATASRASGKTDENQCEVGKRKRVRDKGETTQEDEGGMFSKNTYVLRNCTREKSSALGGRR